MLSGTLCLSDCRDVEMQNAPPVVSDDDDEEAVQQTERDRRDGKEVHRCNRFAMIAEEGEPTLGWIGVSRRSLHPAGDSSLRDIVAEHEKLSMDPRRSPGRI